MTRPRPAQVAALLGALLGLASLLVLGAPAPHAAAAACGGTAGVTVVVDFTAFDRGVVTACAPGDPTSGLDALAKAGFSWTGVQQQPGFVCRIEGLPDAQQEACVRTPPADAYWAYFHGEGGTWEYATQGAGSHDPEPGDVEGWAFGAEAMPSVPPPARPSPTSRPATSVPTRAVTASPTPRAPRTAGATGAGPTRPAVVSGTAVNAPPAPAGAASTTSMASPTTSGGPATAAPGAAATGSPGQGSEAAAPVRQDGEQGSTLPAVAGAALVVALLGSAVGTARTRRRSGNG